MDEDEIDWDDPDIEAEMNCSMGRDGQCGQAGSEHCDFECPVMRRMVLEEMRPSKSARKRK